jgi:hypothetical protein
MARIARCCAGLAHHVTQRGNRRKPVFFEADDYRLYRRLVATAAPLRALIPDFAALLTMPTDAATTTRIERAPNIGRPLGRPEWIVMLERRLDRPLTPSKPGRKPRVARDTAQQAQSL